MKRRRLDAQPHVEQALQALLEHATGLDAHVVIALGCTCRRLAAVQLRRHALVCSLAQSCKLYTRRHEPHVAHLLARCVHTLDLRNTLVTDVSALGGVHTLNLWGVHITDVSALGDVHTLDLSYTHVTDVSALGSVHTLNLRNTLVTDMSALGGVCVLTLPSGEIRT